MATQSDDLLLKLREGSAEALTTAYERYGGLVYNVCLRVLSNPENAEDATQAVFLLLFRKARSLSAETQLPGWLHKTAVLIARQERRVNIRRHKREQEVAKMTSIITSADPETEAAWTEMRPQLDRAIANLPVRYQTPLLFVYFQGRSQFLLRRLYQPASE
ncbi:MAG: sigma-70 family RNA polymerase sigma factor [Planctomycetota bacterium]